MPSPAPGPLTPDEFVRRAAEAGLAISQQHAAEMDVPGYSPQAAYQAVRTIDFSGFEPAAVFHPVKREGKRP